MENPKLSDTAREQLEEATVAVFMEQYAKALDAGIDKRMEECEGQEFPPELEKRCRALIEKEYAKTKNEKRRKRIMRTLQKAAVVVVALLSLSSILFMTVEAFRLPIINFFVEKTDRYWQMTANPDEDTIPAAFDPNNPLGEILPPDFVLTQLSGTVESSDLIAKYSNGDKTSITLFVNISLGSLQVDSENAVVTDTKVAGHDARLYVEENSIRLAWLDENVFRAFGIHAVNVTEETVAYIAEAFAQYFD